MIIGDSDMIDNHQEKVGVTSKLGGQTKDYDTLRSKLLNMAIKQRVISDQVKVMEQISKSHGVAILPLTVFTFRQQFFEHRLKYFLRELDLFLWRIEITSQPSSKPKSFIKIENKTLGQTIKLLGQYISANKIVSDFPNVNKLLEKSWIINDKRKILIHHLLDGETNLQQVESDSREGLDLINDAESLIDKIKNKIKHSLLKFIRLQFDFGTKL